VKRREFGVIEKKLKLQTRQSGDYLAWFVYEGVTYTRTRRSNKKGDLPASDKIRQQLKLSDAQLRDLLSCTFGHGDYVAHLKRIGEIPDPESKAGALGVGC
jgi:hypothetical protein